ncbi:hypothetical protein LPJ74_006454 [Coemansia sp. RSA 1843]|nr:hypothetical protein LPJ74_006454 [Coemansia sp. RSA 1843]
MRYSSGSLNKRSSLTVWTLALIVLVQADIGSCANAADSCLMNDRSMVADILASNNYQQLQATPTAVAVAGQQRFKHKKTKKHKLIDCSTDDDGNSPTNTTSDSDSDSDSDDEDCSYPDHSCAIDYGQKKTHACTSHQPYGPPPALLPTVAPRPARPDYTSSSSSSGATWGSSNYMEPNIVDQSEETGSPSISAHRPEVGKYTTSTTDSATETAYSSSSAADAYDNVSSAQPVDINDAYKKVGQINQLLRPTKTARLPELLDHTPPPPPQIALPQANYPKQRNRLHPALDPLMPGGVDMYPAIEQQQLQGNDAPAKIDEDVWKLVESLSVDEKVGQMTQIHVGMLLDAHTGDLNMTAVEYWVDQVKVGSVVDTPGNSAHSQFPLYSPQRLANITNTVQQVSLARGSRVPLVWAMDAVRGASYVKHATMFPMPLAQAATFQPQSAYVAGRIGSKDLRASGYQWALGPSADLMVEKKWPDGVLSFGEDPMLASVMVASSVRGYQGDYKRDRARVACCVRNFVGAGQQLGAHTGMRAVSDHQLFEYHLPAFEAAIHTGGAASVMQASGSLNGESLGMSPFYLRHVLRDTLAFRGVMLSDQSDLRTQFRDLHAAANATDAVFLALNNTSVDVTSEEDSSSGAFPRDAMDLVHSGSLNEDRITESVARVVQMKKDLGLFDSFKPFADPSLIEIVGAAQDIEDARNVVRESLTLLKNQNSVLPLSASERVLFLGPHLNSTGLLGGGFNVHMQGPSDREGGDHVYDGFGDTVMSGVRKVIGDDKLGNIAYRRGFRLDSSDVRADEFGQIVRLARKSDKIVIALGEHAYAGATGDVHELALDAHQINFVKQLSIAVNRPIAVVLVEGRPRLLKEVADIADSILMAYLPGIHGGIPIAETLYGQVNPSGRLPLTYPRYESQSRDTIWQGINSEYKPQWAFGHGLGYSKMLFSNITSDTSELAPGKPVTLRMTVQNLGTRDQWEPVLLYTTQAFRTAYEPELLRLRRFDKVLVKQGTAAEVAFTLTAEELAYHTRALDKVVDSSVVNITVNAFSTNQRTISLQFSPISSTNTDSVF